MPVSSNWDRLLFFVPPNHFMDFGARPAAKRGEWERMQMPRYICICTSVRGRKPKGKQRSQRTKKKKKNMHLKSLYCYPGGERAKMQLAAHPRDRRTCSQNHWNTEPLWRQRSKLNVIRKCNKFSQSQTKTGRTQLSASRLENALYQWKKIKSIKQSM